MTENDKDSFCSMLNIHIVAKLESKKCEIEWKEIYLYMIDGVVELFHAKAATCF